MKFVELKKHLQSGSIMGAYCVTGTDAFLRDLSVAHFKNILVPVLPDLNLSIFTQTQDGMQICDACSVLPVCAERRLVLCYDYKGEADEILRYLDNPNPACVLVFVSEKLGDNFAKLVLKTETVDCGKLDDASIARWISGKLSETSTEMDMAAVGLLLNYCDRSMTRISRETEKLAVYRAGGRISVEDVRDTVTAEPAYKVYELSDAVASKNPQRATEICKTLLESGMEAYMLMGVIYAHFRRLLYCLINARDEDLAKRLGVQEYAVKMAKTQARAFSAVRLKRICDQFHELDFCFKQGKITDKAALEAFILRILIEE